MEYYSVFHSFVKDMLNYIFDESDQFKCLKKVMNCILELFTTFFWL